MSKYTFTFKKDDISLEYTTTDKESLEKQFNLWVRSAAVHTFNHEKIKKSSASKEEVKCSCDENEKISFKDEKKDEEHSSARNPIQLESERIIKEYKAEMEAEKRRKETEVIKEEFKQDVEAIVAKEEALTASINELYANKDINTINIEEKLSENESAENELQQTEEQIPEKEPEQESEELPLVLEEIQTEEEPLKEIPPQATAEEPKKHIPLSDFDKILETTIATQDIEELFQNKDEKFLKVLGIKQPSEKLDYLIITAYYLAEFEKLNGFTLKQLNAKLMDNLSFAVDHSILQEAIEKNLVEIVPNYTNIQAAVEYRLTEEGEQLFLSGSDLTDV